MLLYSIVFYVLSVVIVCWSLVICDVGGFDEIMYFGEDVDLCWWFIEVGVWLCYELIVLVVYDYWI